MSHYRTVYTHECECAVFFLKEMGSSCGLQYHKQCDYTPKKFPGLKKQSHLDQLQKIQHFIIFNKFFKMYLFFLTKRFFFEKLKYKGIVHKRGHGIEARWELTKTPLYYWYVLTLFDKIIKMSQKRQFGALLKRSFMLFFPI